MINRQCWVYRPKYYVKRPWAVVLDLFVDIKTFCQRGWRGYADIDSWAIDSYLSVWLPSVLRRYKNGSGVPPGYDQKAWAEALETMALGFEANFKVSNDFFETAQELKALDAQKRRGLALFAKYFSYLWS